MIPETWNVVAQAEREIGLGGRNVDLPGFFCFEYIKFIPRKPKNIFHAYANFLRGSYCAFPCRKRKKISVCFETMIHIQPIHAFNPFMPSNHSRPQPFTTSKIHT
jgi:hypothetical protein